MELLEKAAGNMVSERRNVATPDANRTSAARGILYVARSAARRRSAEKWQSANGEEMAVGEDVPPSTSLRSASVAKGRLSGALKEAALVRKRYDSGGGTAATVVFSVSVVAPAWLRRWGPEWDMLTAVDGEELMRSGADRTNAGWVPAACAVVTALMSLARRLLYETGDANSPELESVARTRAAAATVMV
eukprot:1513042-Pleurochrysis_carterae.AAC.1